MTREPDVSDIGRAVVYTGNRYPGGKLEEGIITSFNAHSVFVRYGSDKHSKATSREDLEWAMTREPEDIVHRLRREVPARGDIGLQQLAAAEIERLRAALESLTKDPPASLAREPDEDWEVIVKMRAIARAVLEPKP